MGDVLASKRIKRIFASFAFADDSAASEYKKFRKAHPGYTIKAHPISSMRYIAKLNEAYRHDDNLSDVTPPKKMNATVPGQQAFWLKKEHERLSVDDLFERLKLYDVVSFDIFDTCLLRKVNVPNDVFDVMAAEMGFSDFVSVRKKAEGRSRLINSKQKGTRETTLSEIYKLLERDYDIDRCWMNRELELEMALSTQNPYIHLLFSKLVQAGVKVVFTTDMYLPRSFIEQLLVKNGYGTAPEIFLSNEHDARKGDGTLQLVLKERFAGKKIVHIGDNKASDVDKTKSRGIDAVHYLDVRRLSSDYDGFGGNIGSSMYKAVINNTMNNGIPFEGSLQYQHGYRVGGVLAAGYCQFINTIVEEKRIEKILFCARDCHVLQQIYNEFFFECENEYLEISRFAILGAAANRYYYDYIGRSALRHASARGKQETIGEILTESGFEYLIDALEDSDIERYLFPSNLRAGKLEEFMYKEKKTVLNHNEQEKRAAKQYFTQLIGDAKKLLVVDVGWTGTCISAFKYFCDNELKDSSLEITGALLCTSRNEALTTSISDGEIRAYLYSPFANMDMTRKFMPGGKKPVRETDKLHMPLEYLFTSASASLARYSLDANGNVEFKRVPLSPPNAEEIAAMQEGMIDFCRMFTQYASALGYMPPISPYVASAPLRQALSHDAYCKEVYGNFYYDATSALYDDSSNARPYRELYEDHDQKAVRGHDRQSPKTGRRILLISPEMIYTGAPNSLRRIASVLLGAGYYVEVWTAKSGPFEKEFVSLGIKVKTIAAKNLASKKAIRDIKDFDIAICNTIVTDAYVRAIEPYIPVVWYIREATNIPDFCSGNDPRLQTLRKSNGITCVSDYAAKAISKHTDMPIRVVHNAVPDDSSMALRSEPRKGRKVRFIQLGTIEYRKGYDVFIEAFKTLPDEYRERIELFFAGGFVNSGTPFCSYLFSEIEREPSIHYLGQIRDNKLKIETISSMDVVVVASRDESCSLVALEGAMLSKPLIVTENVGAKYIVTERNGLIIEPGSVAALRDAFISIVDNVDALDQMGIESRKLYEEKASMRVHEQEILAMISDAIKHYKPLSTKPLNKNSLPKSKSLTKRDKIIVSLTSHPGRITTVARCVQTLLNQTMKPDSILLTLAVEQFPNGVDDLPEDLIALTGRGLTIAWSATDLKPHKKYFDVMQNEGDSIVIVVDDDALYEPELVESLYSCYQENPHAVSCMRANLMLFRPNGSLRSYDNWVYDYRMRKGQASYRLLPTGVGGVLYPPHSIPTEAFNTAAIQKTCINADDLWLKVMASLNGYPTILAPNTCEYKLIEGTQDTALWKNNTDMGGNDESIALILDYVEQKFALKDELLKRLRGIGESGEWIGPDTISAKPMI